MSKEHGQRLFDAVAEDVKSARAKNPFMGLNHYVSSAKRLNVGSLSYTKPEVTLAFVSLPPFPEGSWDLDTRWIVEKGLLKSVDSEACRRRILRYNRGLATTHRLWYEGAVTEAAEQGADIIVVNELGFPSYNQRPLKKAATFTSSLATSNDCLVVAGSSHDKRTLYNTGHVFYPGCPDEMGRQYHKQVSAVAVGELINIPPRRCTLSAKVFGLQVAVLICLDIADYSSVATVVKIADKVDVLLVPCYSEKMEDLERVAKVTSDALSGIVALVNYRRRYAKTPCIISKLGKLVDPGRQVEVEIGDAAKGSTDKPLITFFTIDNAEFEREKLEWQVGDEQEETEWLFGRRNLALRS